MSDCQLDFMHTPVWCPACFQQEREAELLRGNRQIVRELIKSNELNEERLYQDSPERPYKPHRSVLEPLPTVTPRQVKRRGL